MFAARLPQIPSYWQELRSVVLFGLPVVRVQGEGDAAHFVSFSRCLRDTRRDGLP